MADELRRLNGDGSWALTLGGTRLVFDPWLVGSEVDGVRAFHEAWHVDPVVPPAEVGPCDAVVISQRYADHLHPETLAALPPWPRLTVPDARRASTRAAPATPVTVLPSWGDAPVRLGALRLWRVGPTTFVPPRYHAIVVADDHDGAVIHAPHGIDARAARDLGSSLRVRLLAITRRRFELPAPFGGAVGPGPEAADAALHGTRAVAALAIHDETKRSRGLVSRLARVGPAPSAGPPWLDAPVGERLALPEAG